MSSPAPEPKLRCDLRFVLRTALLPWHDVFDPRDGTADLTGERARMRVLVQRADVSEAIFLASPSLHDSISHWLTEPDSARGRKVERVLAKYLARMAGRATPFGLFSAISVGRVDEVAEASVLDLGDARCRRRTRIDNDYLFALAAEIAEDSERRGCLRFVPNTSLYDVAGRIRYAEARLDGRDRSYHLVSVEPTDYLRSTLALAASDADIGIEGVRLSTLADVLVDDDITAEDANVYIGELAAAQLLVPTLGVSVTGPEPIDGFISKLSDATPLQAIRSALIEARGAISAMDASGVGQSPEKYRAIAAELGAVRSAGSSEISRLFQVDATRSTGELTIDFGTVAAVTEAIEILSRMTSSPSGGAVSRFCEAFSARYEDAEVPLAIALDDEAGVGFDSARHPGAEGAPLLAKLGFPPRSGDENRVVWNAREQVLLRLLLDSRGKTELELDDATLNLLTVADPAPLPDAMSAMVRLAMSADGDGTDVLVEGAGGPSGARLLGRFCHVSTEVDAMVREHLRAEEALRPDAVFAEVVHLNEGRIGNIQCRTTLRDYEIPYLGISGVDVDHQIPITDLLVSVRNGRARLRSQSLDREVIPRLSTAHNYGLRSPSMYRFLCSLQGQYGSGAWWSWGALEAGPFTPRVRRGRIVFCRATWRLDASDLNDLAAAVKAGDDIARDAALTALRTSRELPRYVVVADGDNELPIDFDSPLSRDLFAHSFARRGGLVLKEQFPAPDKLPVTSDAGAHVSEVVFTFTTAKTASRAVATDQPRANPPSEASAAPRVRRSFMPGSEWLYAKIYTGASTADRVLGDAVAPVLRAARERGEVDRWFFLRYADPDHHLRVRFHSASGPLPGTVLSDLQDALVPLMESRAVSRLQLDTYRRELERYHSAGIDVAERIFSADSDAVLAIVELLEGDAGKDARWRLALRGADRLLSALGFDDESRHHIHVNARTSFGTEFAVTTAFQRQLGMRYRSERDDLQRLCDQPSALLEDHWLAPGFALLDSRDEALVPLGVELRALAQRGSIELSLDDIAWSYVHMHINRMLHDSQRAQELVIYDLLARHYRARKARGISSTS